MLTRVGVWYPIQAIVATLPEKLEALQPRRLLDQRRFGVSCPVDELLADADVHSRNQERHIVGVGKRADSDHRTTFARHVEGDERARLTRGAATQRLLNRGEHLESRLEFVVHRATNSGIQLGVDGDGGLRQEVAICAVAKRVRKALEVAYHPGKVARQVGTCRQRGGVPPGGDGGRGGRVGRQLVERVRVGGEKLDQFGLAEAAELFEQGDAIQSGDGLE